jgi:Flp pilus assembly protein TadB
MTKRTRERKRIASIVDDLQAIVDRLRSGESLRHALMCCAGDQGSPLRPVATALAAGQPLGLALRTMATTCGDADLASVCCVLSVHAEAGGDPTLAVRALADRLARRIAAREEARALTTQARLGARAILLLTPAFLLLVALSDPRGAVSYLTQPQTRAALIAGLLLQGVGAIWIGAIVNGVGATSSRSARVPLLRAVRAIFTGRSRPTIDAECAEVADTIAFALDAGLSPTASLAAVAPTAHGAFGVSLREAVARVGVPLHESVASATSGLESEGATRFARAFAWSAELGVPLADAMRALSDDLRERAALHFSEDIRRASIHVLMPLGVLVLPAFVLACLVPLFVGGLQGIAG